MKVAMSSDIEYLRFLDKANPPTEKQMVAAMGKPVSALWRELRAFLKDNYTAEPELHFGGKNYGWSYRYRQGGRTLCTLYPEHGAFTVLVVMGRSDIVKLGLEVQKLNQETLLTIARAKAYPEGKWLYKRVLNAADVVDVKSLIGIKKSPRQKIVRG